jgi:hypothetical protein
MLGERRYAECFLSAHIIVRQLVSLSKGRIRTGWVLCDVGYLDEDVILVELWHRMTLDLCSLFQQNHIRAGPSKV